MVSLAWLTVCAAVTASPTTTLLTANASALMGAVLAVVLAGAGAVLVGMAGVMAVLDGAGVVVAGAGVIGVGVAGAVLAGAGVSLLASFFMFGMTLVILGRNSGILFFLMTLCILWGGMRRGRRGLVSFPSGMRSEITLKLNLFTFNRSQPAVKYRSGPLSWRA